jgi:hypothetical protein
MSSRRLTSIFPKVPTSSKKAFPKGEKYAAPSLKNNETYRLAMEILKGEEARIHSEIETRKAKKADPALLKSKEVELGYLNMEHHFNFQQFRGNAAFSYDSFVADG